MEAKKAGAKARAKQAEKLKVDKKVQEQRLEKAESKKVGYQQRIDLKV